MIVFVVVCFVFGFEMCFVFGFEVTQGYAAPELKTQVQTQLYIHGQRSAIISQVDIYVYMI